MKPIRKEYPRTREYTKKGHIYFQVDLRRAGHIGKQFRNFTSKATALAFAVAVGRDVNLNGIKSISSIHTDPRIEQWSMQLKPFGKTIEQALDLAMTLWAKDATSAQSPFMSELLNKWVLDKIENKLKPLRPTSIKGIRSVANLFQKDFGEIRIAQIDTAYVENYLSSKECSQRYKHNLLNLLNQFFTHIHKKKYWRGDNPCEGIEIEIIKAPPVFAGIEQVKTLIELGKKYKISGYVSLCLFGGVRPDECSKITWENVLLSVKEVYIPATISKTKKDRRFCMPNNLYRHLVQCDRTQPLIPKSLNLSYRALRKEYGKWTQDIMRHSFATYHYATTHDLKELSHVMGNSPSIIESFYKGALPEADVETWSSL